jgi:hypothetical protein
MCSFEVNMKTEKQRRSRWRRMILPVLFFLAPLCSLNTGMAQETEEQSTGVRLFEAGEFVRAKQILEAHLKSHPKNTQTMLHLGWVALEQNRLSTAVEWFEEATRIASTNSLYFLWLGRAFGLQAREAGVPRGAISCGKAKAAFDKSVKSARPACCLERGWTGPKRVSKRISNRNPTSSCPLWHGRTIASGWFTNGLEIARRLTANFKPHWIWIPTTKKRRLHSRISSKQKITTRLTMIAHR